MARVTTSSSPLMALCLRSCIPTPSLCRRVLNSGGRPNEWESEPLKHIGPGLLRALVLPLLLALIHRSAWNRNSPKFGAFWCSEVFCAMAHIHYPHTGVGCTRYLGPDKARRYRAHEEIPSGPIGGVGSRRPRGSTGRRQRVCR